jgi:hypothetical protein
MTKMTIFPDAGFRLNRDDEGLWRATLVVRVKTTDVTLFSYSRFNVQVGLVESEIRLDGGSETFRLHTNKVTKETGTLLALVDAIRQRVAETIDWHRTGRNKPKGAIGFTGAATAQS